MRFTLDIALDNDAFGPDDFDRAEEIARILLVTGQALARGSKTGACMDINGNTVGAWRIGEGS